jgi:hypothetical protein
MMPNRPGSVLIHLLLTVVCAALAAGCSGRVEAPQVASLGAPAADEASSDARDEDLTTEQALIKLTTCLRKEGLDVPDPKVDSSGNLQLLFGERATFDPNSASAKSAFDRCRKYIDGILQSFTPADIVTVRDTLVDYAKCMRANGYDLPDPNLLSQKGPFGDLDVKNPRFIKADEACRPVLERIQEVISS